MAQNYGTRGSAEEFRVDWDKFGKIVIEKWQDRLLEKDIYDTGNLYRSIEYGYRASNALGQIVGRGHASEVKAGTVPDVFTFKFPMYGIYVERGVGRGYTRGNGGDEAGKGAPGITASSPTSGTALANSLPSNTDAPPPQ